MSERSKSSRRDFLKGRAAIQSLVDNLLSHDRLTPIPGAPPSTVDRQNAYLEHYSKNAMACEFAFLFNMQQYKQSGETARLAFELIDRLEDQLSIYRENSEVSNLNRHSSTQPVKVEQRLFELLQLADRLFKETEGAFDITSGPLSRVWGFYERQCTLPAKEDIDEALNSVGGDQLELDSSSSTVTFANSMVTINLGGIGKGHALDRVVELIESNEIQDFIIHGGQSSVVARGSQIAGGSETEPAWQVGLSHPSTPERRIAEISLRNEALGTSGTGRQGFFVDGQRLGHIVDPRTGWPTTHFLSTTVISPSAAISDALATAFFVMSPEKVETYCRNHPHIKAICVTAGEGGQTNIEWFNLSEHDWKRL